MHYLFIEELLQLLFDNCSNQPGDYVSKFNQSRNMIGFNYCCDENRFTHVSTSFRDILGYNLSNILSNSNFNSKIVHPHDRPAIKECLKRSFRVVNSTSSKTYKDQFKRVKCRARHIKGYWKYFIFYAMDYFNENENSNDKIGLLANERIKTHSENGVKESSQYRSMSNANNLHHVDYLFEYIEHLSPRESEILELISNGLVTKEIASKLSISDSTVVTHRKNLMSKFKVRNTAELIKKAAHRMLI